jgi:hypothetical protein
MYQTDLYSNAPYRTAELGLVWFIYFLAARVESLHLAVDVDERHFVFADYFRGWTTGCGGYA